nr:HAMP domain-containing sensor histidine kinase [Amycolatopsis sp. WAC 01375]
MTIRTRLTLVYGGLFLLAGILLLGATYVLMSRQLSNRESTAVLDAQTFTPEVDILKEVAEETRTDALMALLVQGGLALGLVAAAAIAIGWLIAGRMLQPIDQMTRAARRIADSPGSDRGLHERIALDGPPDEVKRLADTFDLMLERLDHSFDGQRRFIANASHELRTPLTLNRTLLEIAVRRRDVSVEVRQLGETLLEINSRHERLIDGLLTLAKSDRELGELSYVDLADVVTHVAAQHPTVATSAGEAPTMGNAVLLERLVQNLVENGVRYNVPDGWVQVTSGTRPDGLVELVVTNTGPVVPPYELPGLFEPFRRLATDRLATRMGAGLGLSIVRALAHAHGGHVHAEPRGGGGLVVTVSLPVAGLPRKQASGVVTGQDLRDHRSST